MSRRPADRGHHQSGFAQPRNDLTREDPRYFELVTRVRETLRRRDYPRHRRRTVSRRVRRYLPAAALFIGVLAAGARGRAFSQTVPATGAERHPPPRSSSIETSSPRRRQHAVRSGRWLRDRQAPLRSRSPSQRHATAARSGCCHSPSRELGPIIAFAPIMKQLFRRADPLSQDDGRRRARLLPIMIKPLSEASRSLIPRHSSSCVPTGERDQHLLRLRIPNSLPFVFTALQGMRR